jgi:hypothetical protein
MAMKVAIVMMDIKILIIFGLASAYVYISSCGKPYSAQVPATETS